MTQRRIVDLSLTFRNERAGVSIEPQSRIADKGYNTSNVTLYSQP
jgi:hypothetical protein